MSKHFFLFFMTLFLSCVLSLHQILILNIGRQSMMKSLKEFLDSSTIHGLSHISTSRSTRPYISYMYIYNIYNINNIFNLCHISTSRSTISDIKYIYPIDPIDLIYPRYPKLQYIQYVEYSQAGVELARLLGSSLSAPALTYTCKKVLTRKQNKILKSIQSWLICVNFFLSLKCLFACPNLI